MARASVYLKIAAMVIISVLQLVGAVDDSDPVVFKGRDAARCKDTKSVSSNCKNKVLICPWQCPRRSTVGPGRSACFIDCSPKCQSTCRNRHPRCSGYGSICYDPRFVGGDGVMFYFHGSSNKDFCIVSDTNLHINAHFIGKRTEGRKRDYTWVQALGILYGQHKLIIAAKKVATWDDKIDQFRVSYDGVLLSLPEKPFSTWASESGETAIERLGDNTVLVSIDKLMTVSVRVVPVTDKENKDHNYQIDADNCFAHLDLQFQFLNMSSKVDGVLGQTYRPDFKSPVKVGVPMPIMGGYDKFSSSSLLSTDCKLSIFDPNDQLLGGTDLLIQKLTSTCRSEDGQRGIVCR